MISSSRDQLPDPKVLTEVSVGTSTHPDAVHVFDEDMRWLVCCALAARRPLLLLGEPGTGKSQVARAVATAYRYPFLDVVIDAGSSCHDLCWRFDAVRRLADAQLLAALGGAAQIADEQAMRERLDERRYLEPGPLWWALDWRSAVGHYEFLDEKDRQKGSPAHLEKKDRRPSVPEPARPEGDPGPAGGEPGAASKDGTPEPSPRMVVLIDEIDKADPDLPNGLLDVLGNGWFSVPYAGGFRVDRDRRQPFPLVVITSNRERELPPAFLRRCLVHYIPFPEKDILGARARAHFRDERTMPKPVIDRAVTLLLATRARAKADDRMQGDGIPPAGQAEFFDLLRTVQAMAIEGRDPEEVLTQAAGYHLRFKKGE